MQSILKWTRGLINDAYGIILLSIYWVTYFTWHTGSILELKAFMQKRAYVILGSIFILHDRALIFGRLTCFDMKSIVA